MLNFQNMRIPGRGPKYTLNKYRFSEIKSALQKYIRRSQFRKGLKCIIENEYFRILESCDDALAKKYNDDQNNKYSYTKKDIIRRVKTIRTNLINRLIVTMSEEVNINERI